jgi:predicted ABC-type ATPase
MAERAPGITVLAGTNGAGKSSIIGEFIRARGGTFYNPDEAARKLKLSYPKLRQQEANGLAWTLGKEGLETAIARRTDYVLETTLGGHTIPALLADAARQGIRVTVWYVGLGSVEEHIRRVRARVQRGGHDIHEDKIRERYVLSLENLVGLMRHLHELKLFDNSQTVDMTAGEAPKPRALLHYKGGEIIEIADLRAMPAWAKPVIMAALQVSKANRR